MTFPISIPLRKEIEFFLRPSGRAHKGDSESHSPQFYCTIDTAGQVVAGEVSGKMSDVTAALRDSAISTPITNGLKIQVPLPGNNSPDSVLKNPITPEEVGEDRKFQISSIDLVSTAGQTSVNKATADCRVHHDSYSYSKSVADGRNSSNSSNSISGHGGGSDGIGEDNPPTSPVGRERHYHLKSIPNTAEINRYVASYSATNAVSDTEQFLMSSLQKYVRTRNS